MNKRFARAGALGGAIVALGLLTPTAALAAECGTPAQKAVYKTVTTPATDPVWGSEEILVKEAVPAQEAVYEDVKVIDQPYVPEVPPTPAVEEVSHYEKKLVKPETTITIVVKPAWTEYLPGNWWNFSPNDHHGPFAGPPAFPTDPRGTWQGPHVNGGPGKDQVGTFQQGNGHGSWFHREIPIKIEHPAVTRDIVTPAVYEWVKVIDVEAQPAKPGSPAIPEVSHIERRLVKEAVPAQEAVYEPRTFLIKDGTPASKKPVLVKAAVPAGEPCKSDETPPVAVEDESPGPNTGTPETLAYTGSETQKVIAWVAGLLLGGAALIAAGRKLDPSKQ